jgi:hypothetical protein
MDAPTVIVDEMVRLLVESDRKGAP